MNMLSCYSEEELREMGVTFGKNVSIDRSVRFFSPNKIIIGSNVRIDCFSIISANEPVIIGNFVHLAPYVAIFGAGGVEINDYVGISSRVSVYSVSDDYSSGYLANPTIPHQFRKVESRKIVFQSHSIIGSGSVILPGVVIGRGASIGALSLVNKSIPDYVIVSGNPVRKIGQRNRDQMDQLAEEHAHSLGIK